MQIANGMVILSPENQQFKYGVTPAEAVILYKMHNAYANGTPLGDFYIQEGEAQTIDVPEKAAQEEERNLLTGKITPAKEAVPAATHKRTQGEEIARLKKIYTGIIQDDGVAKTAFVGTFGSAVGVRIPETFAEIEDVVHITFKTQPKATKAESEANNRKNELLSKLRTELCEIAGGLKLKIHAQDTKEAIVGAIIEAEKETPKPEVT
jgi:hypothetical protein